MVVRAKIATLVAAFLALFGFLVFQAGIASQYQRQHQREPQRSESSHDNQQIADNSSPSQAGIKIECDPNCAAESPNQNANEGPIARLVRKTVDDPLTLFTAILAVGTLMMAIYTAVVARATKTAADHIPTVERAYLFGGPTKIEALADKNVTNFKLIVDNSGKTPAIINEVCIRYLFSEPSGLPNYTDAKISWVDFMINAGVSGQILPFDAGLNTVKPFFVAGYFGYLDIFRKSHKSRFCVRIRPDLGQFEMAGGVAWNDWD